MARHGLRLHSFFSAAKYCASSCAGSICLPLSAGPPGSPEMVAGLCTHCWRHLNQSVSFLSGLTFETYHARQARAIDPGNFCCEGGHVYDPGCDRVPINKRLRGGPGQPCKKRRDGNVQDSVLFNGSSGIPRQVTIIARNENGSNDDCQEPWKPSLVSFDIEDKNGGGVSEP